MLEHWLAQAPVQAQSRKVLKTASAGPQRALEPATPVITSLQVTVSHAAHCPFTQAPPQHVALCVQAPPFAVHAPHLPFTQPPLQQLLLSVQSAPSDLHVAHTPFSQNGASQHSPAVAHAPPVFAQHVAAAPHDSPLQQPESTPPQDSPEAPQGMQVPWWQMLEQQSLASVQVEPSVLQVPHLSL